MSSCLVKQMYWIALTCLFRERYLYLFIFRTKKWMDLPVSTLRHNTSINNSPVRCMKCYILYIQDSHRSASIVKVKEANLLLAMLGYLFYPEKRFGSSLTNSQIRSDGREEIIDKGIILSRGSEIETYIVDKGWISG